MRLANRLNELSYKSQSAVTTLKNREVESKLQTAILEASKNHTKVLGI